MDENIKWMGQSGFMLKGEKTIYIDPWKTDSEEKADIILITHAHYDHCNPEVIMKISNENTSLLITPDCQSKVKDFPGNVVLVEPDNNYDIEGIKIETVPAYNINKQFHPKENEWVGYIMNIDGKRIYHAGDTDAIPEMKALKNIDVALVPVGGTYTMNAEEAAEAVNEFIMPKLAMPMHFGDIVGSKEDAERFKKLCKCKVEIP